MTVYNFGTLAVDIHLLKIISNYIAATYATMSILLAGKLFHANKFRVISDGVWSVVMQHEVTSTLLLQLVRQSLCLNMQQELSGLVQMGIHVCLSLVTLFSANSSKHEGQTVLQIDVLLHSEH